MRWKTNRLTSRAKADVIMLDGKHIIEAVVDLQNNKLLSWQPIKDAHGMVLLDDFASVQNIINNSEEFAAAVKKRGITDAKKVITTPLTVGYFDGKDGLKQDARLLKVISYLDVGDGNYWAHPIENLVAVVDLEQKKIVKIEEGPVVPVPMTARPFDGRDRVAPAVKPMQIIEPEGKNYTHYWRYDSLAELGFSPQHELSRRADDLHRDL
ncbi:tyramine oxidase [Escherichia coli]|uniref:Amine oxidase n=1 Tax=Escherichia coli TaxID=562 RepID=A0A2X1MX20_ECOLX|nr:tyramine oxidase [Escherichia coli]